MSNDISASDRREQLAGCTIISRNYLSHARILAKSFLSHHPGARFYALVIDQLPDGVEFGDARVIKPRELNLPYFFELCFKYDVTELSTAVKPSLLLHLMRRHGERQVIYFDPDIWIARHLSELLDVPEAAGIILTPHLLRPIPLDEHRPAEQDILIAGAYNLGFIALRESEETIAFLRWWEERLRDGCRVDVSRGLMTDQKWVDLVPGLFPSTHIFRDDTYNVAYWNIHARALTRLGRRYLVNGRPLAFFHFSGFNPAQPHTFSRHQNRTSVADDGGVANLLHHYVKLHKRNGFRQSSGWQYGYSAFDNGMSVHPLLRTLYLACTEQQRLEFGNPFKVRGARSFYNWATRPCDGGGLSPFLKLLYRQRYDIATAFPAPSEADRVRYVEWARTQGAAEMGYDARLVDPCLRIPIHSRLSDRGEGVCRSARGANGSPSARNGASSPDAAMSTSPEAAGVNVCGYLRNESGLGAAARGYVRALDTLGVPVTLCDVSELSINRSQDDSLAGQGASDLHEINLICINADQHFAVMNHLGDGFFRGRYNIGIWAWELPRFPEKWYDRFAYYDEVWVGTSFIANMLAPVSPVPVIRVPPVLTAAAKGDRAAGRRRLRAARDESLFLFVFDFHSYFERKNPVAAVRAFRRAFTPLDPARLVIKCVNAENNGESLALLQEEAEGQRIEIHNGYWTAREMRDLMAACDAYVSLHRSEGTGLTLSDAMALGKPVIATGWSGNMDFMSVSNSFPVKYRLVELERNVGPYLRGETWAEPSVEHAAELMRAVVDDPDEAKSRGVAARRDIEAHFSDRALASLIRERLRVIRSRHSFAGLQQRAINSGIQQNRVAYQQLVSAVRRTVESVVPEGATVVVINKGDPQLIEFDRRTGRHFPQNADGSYAGYYPRDSAAAIAHLEALREHGAQYLVVPKTSSWWLAHYSAFADHLDVRYSETARNADCVIYAIEKQAETATAYSDDANTCDQPVALGAPDRRGREQIV